MTHDIESLRSAVGERYAIERELASGGMSTVYIARDVKHGRQVAVKVLRPELAAALGSERFLREIKVTAQLNHPHILALLDSGDAGGLLYYAMPFARGESLRDRLSRERQLPVEDALTIACEVADALGYAHSQGVVHRDIKPENILIENGHAVVVDFGIARAINLAGGDTLTATGIAVGTSAYMSPEQASGSEELDGRSDIYSLGCVLHEMLAGQPPFTGATAAAIVHQHLAVAPPDVTSLRPSTPSSVAAALTRALAKIPADRFTSASAFAAALKTEDAAVPTDTSRSPVLSMRFVPAAAGVILLLATAAVLTRGRAGQPAARDAVFVQTAIAVLPFSSLSAEAQHGYFAAGLHDELLTQLSKIAALSVRSRTSVLGYAGSSLPPLRQIANELEVGSLVEGSVQVVGNRLRVNVQLIDAATNAHLWGDSYDRTLDDAFAIQSEIAQRVVSAVGAALSGKETRQLSTAPTANAEAYRLFLQGKEYRNRPAIAGADLRIAQGFYERALALDSGFALAHAALSEVHGMLYFLRMDRSPERSALQREHAEIALRLAPELPEARAAIGIWHYRSRGDYPRALAELEAALRGKPNDAEVLEGIGQVERRMGNEAAATKAYEKMAQLAPRDAAKIRELGVTYAWRRRYAEAAAAFDRAFLLAPDVGTPAIMKGELWVRWRGELDTLREALVSTFGSFAGGVNPGAFPVQYMLWSRSADSMLAAASRRSVRGQLQILPAPLLAAYAHRLRGDDISARGSFEASLLMVDSLLREHPDDERVHAARGLTLAGVGRREEAQREAEWLTHSVPYRQDKFQGTYVRESRARILAQSGDVDGALDEIESLLRAPSHVTVHTLRLDPLLDPIRANPRFQALLRKYALPER